MALFLSLAGEEIALQDLSLLKLPQRSVPQDDIPTTVAKYGITMQQLYLEYIQNPSPVVLQKWGVNFCAGAQIFQKNIPA